MLRQEDWLKEINTLEDTIKNLNIDPQKKEILEKLRKEIYKHIVYFTESDAVAYLQITKGLERLKQEINHPEKISLPKESMHQLFTHAPKHDPQTSEEILDALGLGFRK